jgi:hypothetical protein
VVEIPAGKLLCFTARKAAYVNLEQPIQWFSVNQNCLVYANRGEHKTTTMIYRVKRPLRVVVWNAVTMHLAYKYANADEKGLLAQITGVSLSKLNTGYEPDIIYRHKNPNRVRYQDSTSAPGALKEVAGRVLMKVIYRLAKHWGQDIDGLFFDYRLLCPGELVTDYFLFSDNYSELILIHALQDTKVVRIRPETVLISDEKTDLYNVTSAVMEENNTLIGWHQSVRTWQTNFFGHLPRHSNSIVDNVIQLRRIPKNLPEPHVPQIL